LRSVFVPPLERSVPRLGVGCASIMGRVGRSESLDALSAAYEGGARYFDVARSYGYGGAERLVGEFLRSRRDECVVVTKAGILPSVPGLVNRLVLPTARRIARFVPAIQRVSARRGPALAGVSKGNFEPATVIESVETSLRELGFDRVDILLLHDVRASDLDDDELLRRLEELVASGKVGGLGIATNCDDVVSILSAEPRPGIPLEVAQLRNHIAQPDLDRVGVALAARGATPSPCFVTTHSALAVTDPEREDLTLWLERHPDQVAPLREVGLVEGDVRRALPAILLGWALAANPDGMTLCGMLSRDHVAKNLRTADLVDRCAESLIALGDAWRASRVSARPDPPSESSRGDGRPS